MSNSAVPPGAAAMRAFIRQKLEEILDEWKDLASRPRGLCGCRSFTDKECDYKERVQQAYYLLHYLPAYLGEYWHMYMALLARDFLGGSVNVVSVGCGCGLDLWGLRFAFEDAGYDPRKGVSYIGVDHALWRHADRCGLPRAQIHAPWDFRYLQVLDGSCNVLHFPMSLNKRDMKPDTFARIRGIIAKGPWSEERVVLIATSHQRPAKDEIARLKTIAEEVVRCHGYAERRDCSFAYDDALDAHIQALCDGFEYPRDLLERVHHLHSLCATLQRSPSRAPCSGCRFPLRRSPVLHTQNFNYVALALEKRERRY